MDLSWYGIAHRHLLIGRGMKRLWRSHDAYPGGKRVDVNGIALSRDGSRDEVARDERVTR